MSSGPEYDKASAALDEAHKACLKHPERDVLGMSSGPFSGVNVALGIVHNLEKFNAEIRHIGSEWQQGIKDAETAIRQIVAKFERT